jgi:branched-chain amino acid transport system permease protein
MVIAMAGGALVGALVEFLILRRMVGQPVFAIIMVTIGLFFFLEELVPSVWGVDNLDLGDPWGLDTVKWSDVTVQVQWLWTIGLATAVMLAFFLFFRYSKMGVAMRATAFDQEAALAQGISARRVNATSWAIAGAVAALAGVTAAAGPGQLRPGLGTLALFAFPAMILGGLDSAAGAVVGGLIIGLAQNWTAGYQDDLHLGWLGNGFNLVMPYVVMVVILLVRPYGLFGTKEVRRV